MLVFRALLITLLASIPGQVFAKETIELEPTSSWFVDYADNVCILARKFGPGDSNVILRIISSKPGHSFFLSAEGHPAKFKGVSRGSRAHGPTFAAPLIRFGKGGKGIKATAWSLFFDKIPGFKAVSYFMIGPQGPMMIAGNMQMTEADWPSLHPAETEIAASKIDRIAFEGEFSKDFVLMTGPLAEPLKALRACTDDLAVSWGIDLEADKSLQRRASPVGNPGDWYNSSDYPTSPWLKNQPGESNIIVIINADGTPANCMVPLPLGDSRFAARACRIIRLRGKFEPAIDAEGNPIKSYWSTRLSWQVQ